MATTTPSSALQRLVTALDAANKVGTAQDQIIADVWAVVYQYQNEPEPVRYAESARIMSHLHDQLILAREELKLTNVPEEDYAAALASVDQAISFRQMMSAWAGITLQVSGSVLGLLRVCSRSVPASEVLLAKEELLAIDEKLAALEQHAKALPASDVLAQMLLDQVKQFRRARRLYEVVGASALRRALYEFDAAMAYNVEPRIDGAAEPAAISEARSLSTLVRQTLIGVAMAAAAMRGAQELGKIAGETTQFYLGAPKIIEHVVEDAAIVDLSDDAPDGDFTVEEDARP